MTTSIVTLSTEDLHRLVVGAVAEALAAHDNTPRLLDREGLARALTCSPGHVDNLRRVGLPTVMLGDDPRFDLTDVVAWLKRPRPPLRWLLGFVKAGSQ